MIGLAPRGGQYRTQTVLEWSPSLFELGCRQTHAHRERGIGFSYADTIQFDPLSGSSARAQSERSLDLPEAAGRRAEGCVRGKSERSERNDGGCCDHAQTGGLEDE